MSVDEDQYPMTGSSANQVAKPTEADRRVGREMLAEVHRYAGHVVPEHVHEWIVRIVADTLAEQRAAVHARYEAVAAELNADSREYDAASERANWPGSRARAGGMSGMALEAAARIRQVASQ